MENIFETIFQIAICLIYVFACVFISETAGSLGAWLAAF